MFLSQDHTCGSLYYILNHRWYYRGVLNDDLSSIGIPISSKNFSKLGGVMINNNLPTDPPIFL